MRRSGRPVSAGARSVSCSSTVATATCSAPQKKQKKEKTKEKKKRKNNLGTMPLMELEKPCRTGDPDDATHRRHAYRTRSHEGKLWLLHRLTWTLTYGPIPDGLHILHHCDNPPCDEPTHLFVGTPADNAHDKIAKGRMGKVGRPRSYTPEIAEEIRRRYAPRPTLAELAEEYGLAIPTIHKIIRGPS